MPAGHLKKKHQIFREKTLQNIKTINSDFLANFQQKYPRTGLKTFFSRDHYQNQNQNLFSRHFEKKKFGHFASSLLPVDIIVNMLCLRFNCDFKLRWL